MLFEMICHANDNLREARSFARGRPDVDVHELLDRAQAILMIAEAITAPTAKPKEKTPCHPPTCAPSAS